MTKDEALEVLREVKGYTLPTGLLNKLDNAIAALSESCPTCGGREPLANMTVQVPESRAGIEASFSFVWSMFPAIEPGSRVRVLILPADEPKEEA